MWEYHDAFIWCDHPKIGLRVTDTGQHSTIIGDLTYRYPDDIWDWLSESPLLPGHIGRWININVRNDEEPGTRPEKNPEGHEEGDLIAVFFSHNLMGNWKPRQMAQFKEEALEALHRHYGVPVREATKEEWYKNLNDPAVDQTKWFTGISDESVQEHTARTDYNMEQARRYLDQLYPTEVHSVGGDCLNPKCDYEFNDQDKADMTQNSGWFTCPRCDYSYNYLDPTYNVWGKPGGGTRAGLTMDEMGAIGEEIVARLGSIEGVGQIIERHPGKKFPLDFTIGRHAVEVKTNHSEAQPRFKLGGQEERRAKIEWATSQGLTPALVGVRLNFYTDRADIFFRNGLTDTWIGNAKMPLVASVDFSDLNPFRNPADVPPATYLPEDDETPARGSYEDDFPF